MAGRFLYLSDENVWGPLLDGLEDRSYRLVRAAKLFGEHTDDLELLTYAARQGYVLVSSDKDMLAHANDWLESGQKLHGLVFWEQHLQKIFSVGTVEGTGANAQIQRYTRTYPGVHVDGLEQWLYPIPVPGT